jgi:PIN domain nuclease of toxin-antitoxin system
VLLDTQAFLWWLNGSSRLTARARSTTASPDNDVWLSVASCWEIAIKASLGKLRLTTAPESFLREQLAANRFALLGLELDHACRVAALPFYHRDPFDRLLAAQALEEELAVISADAVFERYGVERIW